MRRRPTTAPTAAALAAAAALAGCLAQPQAFEFPSPDGAYLVRAELDPLPALVGRRDVELTLRHVEGEPVPVARFGGLTRLEMAWLGVGRLRICAEAKDRETRERVEVASPRGRRVFAVSYGCPALGVRAPAAAAPADRPAREGERRLADRRAGEPR